MRWFAHSVVAGASCAIIAPALVPIAVAGGTAPDWFEWVAKATGQPIKHRGPTHYLTHWVGFCLIGFYLHPAILTFALGGLSHVLLDAMTIQGIPASPWSKQNMHLFGGRFRTGETGEYIFAGAYAAICLVIAGTLMTEDFAPFFFQWGDLYETGIIDGQEWKTNRFRWI